MTKVHLKKKTKKRKVHLLFVWTEEYEKAFVHSKSKLVADKVLVPYDEKRKLILTCDAFPYGVGAVISHVIDDGEEHPIALASRTLTKSKKNYSQIEKEALGIVLGVYTVDLFTCLQITSH